MLKIKDNVVHAGHSVPQEFWKVSSSQLLVNYQTYLNNNYQIAQLSKISILVAMVVSHTEHYNMLREVVSQLKLLIHILLFKDHAELREVLITLKELSNQKPQKKL